MVLLSEMEIPRMRSFSQRFGHVPTKASIQVDSMDKELRNSLWNVLQLIVWEGAGFLHSRHGTPQIENFSAHLWAFYFKQPVDTRPGFRGSIDVQETMKYIREYYFRSSWHEVYSFIEFVAHTVRDRHPELPAVFNKILEQELSGYRFIDQLLTPITSQEEVETVADAIGDGRFRGVDLHLKRSLELLADRKNPDYRNSIKEAISAVEAMARHITGNPRATLGDALNTLGKEGKLHNALSAGFKQLYGYTSDEGGIRHAMLDESTVSQADAKYFLISCSAFVNYLKSTSGQS